MKYLSRADEILLLAILRLKDNAYGVTIVKEVENRIGKKLTFGGLWVSLDNLCKRGLLNKTIADPTPERGGRAVAGAQPERLSRIAASSPATFSRASCVFRPSGSAPTPSRPTHASSMTSRWPSRGRSFPISSSRSLSRVSETSWSSSLLRSFTL